MRRKEKGKEKERIMKGEENGEEGELTHIESAGEGKQGKEEGSGRRREKGAEEG